MGCALTAVQGDRWGALPPPLPACRRHQLPPSLAASRVQCPNTKVCKTCGRDKTCSECAQGFGFDSSRNCKPVGSRRWLIHCLPPHPPPLPPPQPGQWASAGKQKPRRQSPIPSPLLQCTTPQCEFCTASNSRCTNCNYAWYLLLGKGTCAPCGLAGCADCVACTQGADCLNGRKCILKCQDKACAVCEKDLQKCQLCSTGSYLLPSGACKACGLDSCADCQACSGGAGCTGGRKCVQKCADKRCRLCDGNARVCKECAKNYYEDARTGGCNKVWEQSRPEGVVEVHGGSATVCPGSCRPALLATALPGAAASRRAGSVYHTSQRPSRSPSHACSAT